MFEKKLRKKIAMQKEAIKQYKKLLLHIAKRCDDCCKTQYYGNPNIGFRHIKELAVDGINPPVTYNNNHSDNLIISETNSQLGGTKVWKKKKATPT